MARRKSTFVDRLNAVDRAHPVPGITDHPAFQHPRDRRGFEVDSTQASGTPHHYGVRRNEVNAMSHSAMALSKSAVSASDHVLAQRAHERATAGHNELFGHRSHVDSSGRIAESAEKLRTHHEKWSAYHNKMANHHIAAAASATPPDIRHTGAPFVERNEANRATYHDRHSEASRSASEISARANSLSSDHPEHESLHRAAANAHTQAVEAHRSGAVNAANIGDHNAMLRHDQAMEHHHNQAVYHANVESRPSTSRLEHHIAQRAAADASYRADRASNRLMNMPARRKNDAEPFNSTAAVHHEAWVTHNHAAMMSHRAGDYAAVKHHEESARFHHSEHARYTAEGQRRHFSPKYGR